VPTYSREIQVSVDAPAAYAYLSDVQNLPSYFPMITEAKQQGSDEVATTAVIEPPGEERQTVHGTAWFKHDDEAKRVTWGSEGPNDYHGEIDVDGGDGASTVRFTLHTESGHPGIDESIDDTLGSIKSHLEHG
jgi:carbon monoxide dehydrogenase subunit G